MLLITSLTLLSLAYAVPHPRQASSPTVTIDSGVIVGVQTSVSNSPNLVNKFLGIPFAASPTRFSPPQLPTPWTQPFQATQNGPACIQQFVYPEPRRSLIIAAFNNPPPPESEDCLSVNVFTPAGSSGELKAVMFWIYGGSLQYGSNSQQLYDGASFAANQDVVIVTINYRTNVFGFPESPALPLQERNLGYLDQRFALAWVQRNIASFGGNPSKVTIFGESAGSSSVDALVTSFETNTPFRAAIMQSGQISGRNTNSTSWQNLTTALACSNSSTSSDQQILACMRAIPATTIKDLIEKSALSFRPVADDFTSLQYPRQARKNGKVARVPILTGSNSDEGILFTFGQNDTKAYLDAYFGGRLSEDAVKGIIGKYKIGERGIFSTSSQISQIFSELGFQCPSAIAANDSAAAGVPSWRYWYNGTFPEIQPLQGIDFSQYGAYHASEIPIVFGTYAGFGKIPESGKRLSELMQNMWATFAKNPYGGPAPGWEGAEKGSVQVLGGRGGLDGQGRLRRAGNNFEIDGDRCEIWRPTYIG